MRRIPKIIGSNRLHLWPRTRPFCRSGRLCRHPFLALADAGAYGVPGDASYAGISPHGCYYKTDPATADSARLYLNVAGSTEGTVREGYRAVCSNPNF